MDVPRRLYRWHVPDRPIGELECWLTLHRRFAYHPLPVAPQPAPSGAELGAKPDLSAGRLKGVAAKIAPARLDGSRRAIAAHGTELGSDAGLPRDIAVMASLAFG